MAELSWGKANQPQTQVKTAGSEKIKFMIGGLLLLVGVVYLIVSGTSSGARYFITVDELVKSADYVGKTVRISGSVIGDSIVYDSQNLIIDFTIANIPENTTDLAATLHDAVNDPNAARVSVHVENQVMPDLLKHEAQAILTGVMGEDGVFRATELLLKCPSRYEESVPEQSQGGV
ncbi:MAG: cytochrome c maturation protein CcmE [Anaerolineae bacterium]|nr:cytochrome c maturation protein CcmE [Anaerolineae bacterium]